MKRQHAIDLIGLLGFALVVEGARRVYPPAAFLVAGGALLAFAFLATNRGGRP